MHRGRRFKSRSDNYAGVVSAQSNSQRYVYLLFIYDMSKQCQQRIENAIPVPTIYRGFLILVPRASFSFLHVVGDFKMSSARAKN